MRNNETGEVEVVVGNRQLLSGFFVVVLLCAVAFAMGYVVGENAHSTKATAETTTTAPESQPAENRPEPSPSAVVQPAAPPPVEVPAPAPVEEAPHPTTKSAPDVQPPPTAAPAAAPAAKEEVVSGSYWQVLATANPDSAQTMLQTLKDKGFAVSLSPGPNNLTRVLIGPYRDTTSMGRAKTELENAGLSPHLFKR